MNDNINKMTENLSNADELEQETYQMRVNSEGFRDSATSLKRTMWWRNMKLWLIIGGVVAVIALILIVIIIIVCSTGGGDDNNDNDKNVSLIKSITKLLH